MASVTTTLLEDEQGEIIRELYVQIGRLKAEKEQLEAANRELDADLGHALRTIKYMEARLALEKAGYKCTCGDVA